MNTHRTSRIFPAPTILASAAVLLAIAGCATTPMSPPGAADARAKLTRLQSDPNLVNRAPGALKEAEAAVRTAEQPISKDEALGAHRVYMADRKVEIAAAAAATRYAEDQRSVLEAQRSRARLDARTQEADAARADAEAARKAAALASGDAEAARAAAADANSDAAELQRQIAEMQAEVTDRGLVLTLGNVLFATGKSDVKVGAASNLNKLVTFLEKYPDRTAAIEGHTDNVGSDSSNQALSQRRAESVRAYLVQQGISARRLTAIGMGEGDPVADNDTTSGRQQNRRVVVVIDNPPAKAAGTAN